MKYQTISHFTTKLCNRSNGDLITCEHIKFSRESSCTCCFIGVYIISTCNTSHVCLSSSQTISQIKKLIGQVAEKEYCALASRHLWEGCKMTAGDVCTLAEILK